LIEKNTRVRDILAAFSVRSLLSAGTVLLLIYACTIIFIFYFMLLSKLQGHEHQINNILFKFFYTPTLYRNYFNQFSVSPDTCPRLLIFFNELSTG
jgi:hypothetical protein